MEDNKRWVVLLSLLDAMRDSDSWCGETHVQKCAYFLQDALGVPLGLQFILYKHGPYSFDLRELLGEMRSRLLLDVEPRYPYGASLKVSDSGQRYKTRFPKTTGRYAEQVRFIASKLARLGVAELERLGTAFYILRENERRSADERARRINELKPHVTLEQATKAVEEVDRLLADAEALRSAA